MKYQPTIFPELLGAKWGQANLGKLAENSFPDTDSRNLLLNAYFCDQWVLQVARNLKVDFTWGGHFENRKHLWRGYYKNAQKVTHLGVDYNVPAGTKVAAPRKCTVVDSWADTSINNGWGGRLILQLDEPWENAPYLVLGHLAHANLPQVGQVFEAGEIITVTGEPYENGGWFPHLHVQCVNEDFYQAHKSDLTLLDGYYLVEGKPYDFAPDPSLLVGNNLL